ncbi:GNAT family N-acetyltransferase [Flammeovirga kamogawensis]|uniref:GNAT family N-acetyltransferase n=1 Tax=Flammeovirga kamogawensis TaxID=373891 RepID=A0ABX8GWR8_9BACT|nr:GNAT family N-acetyltransferase [Flammeovirga kamogawensis]MBB6461302.1 GNAT superfamily N-acetyltransferase [Flammeovirga kamogawensis]QWG07859.1 GNAT family N-acetyltransferase [Flammeovirga kamogawensis]TRX69666.1 GNAT family N-acetyltransferase [Flammeovirga kamogawensis]
MGKYTIKIADSSYVNTIADFQVKMALETEDYKLDLATVTKGVQHIFDNQNVGRYVIVEDNGKCIASMLNLYEWSDWRCGNVLWIHSLFVIEEYRRQGIFRDMYEFVKNEVDASEDLRGLRLYVEKNNDRAQKTYKAMGMTKEHYDMYEWLK